MKGIIKGRGRGKDFPQEAFQSGPEMFNRIEFRGSRAEEREVCTQRFGQQKVTAFWNGKKHYPLQSQFLVPEKAEAGWKTRIQKACCSSSRYTEKVQEFCRLSERRQCHSSDTFIHISDLFQRYIFELFLIRRCFLLVLLLVAGRLFFLVSLFGMLSALNTCRRCLGINIIYERLPHIGGSLFYAYLMVISFASSPSRVANCSRDMAPKSSPERCRTETVPFSISRSPTTSM